MMLKLSEHNSEPGNEATSPVPASTQQIIVELVDGSSQDLNQLSVDELYRLQWEQESAFAKLIKDSEKGSVERTQIINLAYKTVCQILSTVSDKTGAADFVMGMDQRYTRLVLDKLKQLQAEQVNGGLFELGFGSGVLLEAAADAGFRVGGLEVADQLYHEVQKKLPPQFRNNLCLGDFLNNKNVDSLLGQFSLVYWNDVFEHIPVDEIEEYPSKIHQLLVPGGELITITPNWHMRPMDVTSSHFPPRSEAIGFHLKEYTLSEVCVLLKRAGFHSIRTPVFVSKQRIYQERFVNLTCLKRLVEPMLELIPYSAAVQCCRRFGFCCTIAKK